MNKQLQRDLQSFIQTLKSSQLANVMAHYESLTKTQYKKNFISMNYECQVTFRNQTAKGYGRSEQESLSNATKNLLSGLVGKNIDTDKITLSLKYKNGCQQKSERKNEKASNEKDLSLILDDISMIQSVSRIQKCDFELKSTCECVYYEMHLYNQSQIKHLQARVNLLTQQNQLLKKMLHCGSSINSSSSKLTTEASSNKENEPMYANSIHYEKKLFI